MSDFHEIRKMASKLEEYSALMGDEYGEALDLLCELHYRAEYLGDDFEEDLASMILKQHEYLTENAKIVTEKQEVTRTIESRSIEWINE